MPELFACLFVFVVSVSAYLAARFSTGTPLDADRRRERHRLQQQLAWLEERLQRSWKENWEQDMRARLVDEIEEVEAQLERATPVPQNLV